MTCVSKQLVIANTIVSVFGETAVTWLTELLSSCQTTRFSNVGGKSIPEAFTGRIESKTVLVLNQIGYSQSSDSSNINVELPSV